MNIYDNERPLCLLSPEEQADLKKHHAINGVTLGLVADDATWVEYREPVWAPSSVYRAILLTPMVLPGPVKEEVDKLVRRLWRASEEADLVTTEKTCRSVASIASDLESLFR